MRIRWLSLAGDDLENVELWHLEHAPAHVADVAQKILSAAHSLSSLPYRGRTGQVEGTRELLIHDAPYLLVYVVRPDAGDVIILRLLHQHQLWPPQ